MVICTYPQLFAAYHVFRRLLMPRHSPYALPNLTSFKLLLELLFDELYEQVLFTPLKLCNAFAALPVFFLVDNFTRFFALFS